MLQAAIQDSLPKSLCQGTPKLPTTDVRKAIEHTKEIRRKNTLRISDHVVVVDRLEILYKQGRVTDICIICADMINVDSVPKR